MLKEERALRDLIKDLDTDHSCCPTCGTSTERHQKGCRWGVISPAIRALVRAVREDCAKVAHAEVHTWVGPIAEANREMVANGVADAIRERK